MDVFSVLIDIVDIKARYKTRAVYIDIKRFMFSRNRYHYQFICVNNGASNISLCRRSESLICIFMSDSFDDIISEEGIIRP